MSLPCNISSSAAKIPLHPEKSLRLYISLQGSKYPLRSLQSLRCRLYNVLVVNKDFLFYLASILSYTQISTPRAHNWSQLRWQLKSVRLNSAGWKQAADRTARLRAILAADKASSHEQDTKLKTLRAGATQLKEIFNRDIGVVDQKACQ